MWYGPLYAFGRVAGVAVRAGTIRRWSRRGPAKPGRPGRGASDLYSRVAKILGRSEGGLSRAAVAAAVETGRALMDRPSVRTSLEAAVARMLGSTDDTLQPTAAVRETANRVAVVLQQRGVVPNRIGVDGLPGCGKSTLTHALADGMGMDRKSLDHEDMNVPKDFTSERTIYEHHRLFRTQEVDVFDAIIYVDENEEVSKARVLQRKREEARGSLVTYVLDYEKLKKIGRLAFELCDGEPISIPGSSLLVKIRPAGGFHAAENIESRLRAAAPDPAGAPPLPGVGDGIEERNRAQENESPTPREGGAPNMTKEELLFLLAYGRPRGGLMAYLLPGAFNDQILQGLLAGMREYLA